MARRIDSKAEREVVPKPRHRWRSVPANTLVTRIDITSGLKDDVRHVRHITFTGREIYLYHLRESVWVNPVVTTDELRYVKDAPPAVMNSMGGHSAERIPLARLLSGVELETTIHTYDGAEDGPTLYVQAAQHGREINGSEVLRRFHEEIETENLAGRIVAVPVADPLTFDRVSYTTPEQSAASTRT